ncbi:MAG: hypothetical protein ACP5NW_00180 [Candidatus Woesearchaeota archaeon]
MEEYDEETEWLHDEILGRRKPSSALLNKRKISRYEMDKFFAEQ